MKIQEIVSDVRTRVETAGKHYQDALKAYVDAQRKAVGLVTKNGQTLANTEIGAAKNVFAAARASFDKARKDGVRKVASNPQQYVPNGRDQIISAYKDTIDLLVQTGSELGSIVTDGYKSVLGKLSGEPTKKSTARKASTAKKSATPRKASASKSTAAKRKTASTRSKSAATSTTKRASSTTARKRTSAADTTPGVDASATTSTPGSTSTS